MFQQLKIFLVTGMVLIGAMAFGQATTHTIHAAIGTAPNGPNSDFTVILSMSPSDMDVAGFKFRIGYDSTQAIYQGITDNTGQPGAGLDYIVSAESAIVGVPYANVGRNIDAGTSANLMNPVNLAQLNFKTTASYSEPQNKIYLHLGRTATGNSGLVNPNFQPVPTEYASLAPTTSSVPDWSMY